jgi:hypothetical protein
MMLMMMIGQLCMVVVVMMLQHGLRHDRLAHVLHVLCGLNVMMMMMMVEGCLDAWHADRVRLLLGELLMLSVD